MNSTWSEYWFIPSDIVTIVCCVLILLLASLFLILIIWDQTCHSVSMLLIANSCLTALVLGCVALSLSVFTLANDLKEISAEDSLCVLRAYLNYALSAELMYSFFLQALHRYLVVVYRTRIFWQSFKCQSLLICLTWMFSMTYPLGFIFIDKITYNADNQICQLPLRLSFALIYGVFCIYLIPVSLTVFLYLKLIFYTKQLRENTMIVHTFVRVQRELKMVQRIVTLVNVIVTIGVPYGIFVFISFFTPPPKYHFRIAFLFTDASLLIALIILFLFTNPLRKSLMKLFSPRPNTIARPGRT